MKGPSITERAPPRLRDGRVDPHVRHGTRSIDCQGNPERWDSKGRDEPRNPQARHLDPCGHKHVNSGAAVVRPIT